jgi:diguanylate cyclase (GGDEF)-like protein
MVIHLPATDRREPGAGHPIRVLVVDDGCGATNGVRDLLAREEDFYVASARSAADAEALLARGGFDAILVEPRFWEGDQGYLRPAIENDPHQSSAILIGASPNGKRQRSPQNVTADAAAIFEGTYLAGVVRRAVAETRAARRKQTMLRWLERDAHTDELTGLHNRSAFDDELREVCGVAAHASSPVGLLLVNVVGTATVNSAYGRDAGDQMIRRAAQGITRSVRGADFAARLGDDDFAVILPGAEIDLVRRIARRITHEIERMNTDEWAAEIPVTVSFGVASGAGCSAERLLEAAEAQLSDHEHDLPPPPLFRAHFVDDDGPSVA